MKLIFAVSSVVFLAGAASAQTRPSPMAGIEQVLSDCVHAQDDLSSGIQRASTENAALKSQIVDLQHQVEALKKAASPPPAQ